MQGSDSAMSRIGRYRLKDNLLLALGVNVLVGIGLSFMLIRSVVQRLETVVGNTRRIKYKMALYPPVSGDDEIAELDQAFREMLETLRQEQDALVSSEARIRHFISAVPVGLMSVVKSGEVEFCNASLTKIFQRQRDEIEGSHIGRFFETGGLSDETFWQQIREKAVERMIELFARNDAGEQFLVEVMLSASDEGKPILASVVNINDKYKLLKLRQAFVAMVSHELRTPLTSLSGFLSLSLSGAYGQFNEEFVKQLSQSQQSTNRLIALVNELLDLEKMDSGTVSVKKLPCLLERVFEQVLNSISVFAQTQGVDIVMPSVRNLEIMGDADRLTQVLVNLISNALVVSSRGSQIHVTCAVENDHLRIAVEDQGPGIAPENREIIFERFQQIASDDVKKKYAGTGLGLAICKAIVEQHGGQIGVDSEVGKGSTFWFTLPYDEDDVD
jgi:PAS domain S-box-containing protein